MSCQDVTESTNLQHSDHSTDFKSGRIIEVFEEMWPCDNPRHDPSDDLSDSEL